MQNYKYCISFLLKVKNWINWRDLQWNKLPYCYFQMMQSTFFKTCFQNVATNLNRLWRPMVSAIIDINFLIVYQSPTLCFPLPSTFVNIFDIRASQWFPFFLVVPCFSSSLFRVLSVSFSLPYFPTANCPLPPSIYVLIKLSFYCLRKNSLLTSKGLRGRKDMSPRKSNVL